MKGSWTLGKVAGIKVQMHWTFFLLLLWVVYANFRQGGDRNSALFSVALVLVLFLCVVLHELGHALMARRFRISTRSITLLPIGGVAALDKMPEKPLEELAVALAGPAVNFVIALMLLLLVPLSAYSGFDQAQWTEFLNTPSAASMMVYILLANLILIAFNMIPAFPMDGGRVLRALLALRFNRAKATQIAAWLGQAVSFLFLIAGLLFNPFLVIIAVFVYFGAYAENRMVQQEFRLKGHTVKEALMTDLTLLPEEATLQEVVEVILKGTEKDFLVVRDGEVVGLLPNRKILAHVKRPDTSVAGIMAREFNTVGPETGLAETLQLMARQRQNFMPVLRNGKLLGAISSENISEFILLRAHQGYGPAG